MNSVERVMAAVSHREPDRIPLDYWGVPEVTERLLAKFDLPDVRALRRHLNVDLTYVGPQQEEEHVRHLADGSYYDQWGTLRRWQALPGGGGYWEGVEWPLVGNEKVEDAETYRWASVDEFDWEAFDRELDHYEGFAIVGGCISTFAVYLELRGVENSLADLALKPDYAAALIENIANQQLEHFEHLAEVAAGRVHFASINDDWGMQTGLMISPTMFREFYKEPIRRVLDGVRAKGFGVFCHSDGSVYGVMDDLVELGIDILNPVQTTCTDMEPRRLKREFGDHVCFHGAVDTQHVLPNGTPEDVRAETLHKMDVLGRRGGYILASCHNIQDQVSTENVMSMYQTAFEHGAYPLELPKYRPSATSI